MLVRDVMTTNPTVIAPTDTLQTALEKMAEVGRRLPVVQEGRLVGIITDRDLRLSMNSPLILRERWQDDYLLQHTYVSTYMTTNPTTISPDSPLQTAANLMLDGRFSGLPVVDEDHHVVGIITVTDLMHALISLLDK